MKISPHFKKPLTVIAVAIAVFVLTSSVHYWAREQRGLLATGEAKTLDHLFQMYAQPSAASKNIILVAIDEASLEAYGRWPWPRDRHGYMVHYLKQAGARAIVFDVMFPEPDSMDPEYDAVFAEEARAAGNVFLPYQLDTSARLPADVLQKGTVLIQKDSHDATLLLSGYSGVKPPIDALTSAIAGLGYINHLPGLDGTTRSIPLLAESHQADRPFSHLAMSVAKHLLNPDRTVLMNGKILFGPASIPLTRSGKMLVNWHGPLERVYQMYSAGAVLRSFTDVRDRKTPFLDPSIFTDKIVFIAGTAASTYDLRVTPVSTGSPGVIVHMAALDNILHNDFMRVAPYWSFLAITFILCLLVAAAFMLIQHYVVKFALVVAIGAAYYGAVVYAFTHHGIWVQLAFPEAAIAATFAVAASVEYLTEGRQRRQLRGAFDKYMAPEVVDEIMRDPERIKLGGEKKELTVLFSDIAGFTTISEGMQPEALVELLNEYLSAMTDIVRQHRGNVNKYLGDGIMAIFGAPLGEPTHPTLGCYAALDSQETLVRLRTQWKARGMPEMTARIGINTGTLVVGNMGSQARMEYTVMGDSVNLASRLEGAGKYYGTGILLGARTYELAQNDIEAREVDLLRVKGKFAPVVVYELLARKGHLDPLKRQVVEVYLRGLAAYKTRDFETARREFEAALKLDSTDGPSKVYLHRAQEFLTQPPPPSWDGVYELRSK